MCVKDNSISIVLHYSYLPLTKEKVCFATIARWVSDMFTFPPILCNTYNIVTLVHPALPVQPIRSKFYWKSKVTIPIKMKIPTSWVTFCSKFLQIFASSPNHLSIKNPLLATWLPNATLSVVILQRKSTFWLHSSSPHLTPMLRSMHPSFLSLRWRITTLRERWQMV